MFLLFKCNTLVNKSSFFPEEQSKKIQRKEQLHHCTLYTSDFLTAHSRDIKRTAVGLTTPKCTSAKCILLRLQNNTTEKGTDITSLKLICSISSEVVYVKQSQIFSICL